jgi:type I restriction enzyme S subunit
MKNKIKKNVPKLRFKEFRNKSEWNKIGLGEFFSDRQETGFSDLPLLSLTANEGIIPQEESNRKNTSNSDKSKYLRVVPGDIAYNTMRMWEGRSAFVVREGLVSPAYTVCKPVGMTNSIFFSYYFKTPQLIKLFHRYSQGLVKDTLNLKYENFTRIAAYAPQTPEEQIKIADCLTSLDNLITAESQKLEALKDHKNGLMQNLFPAEGETVPKVRFPEFRRAGYWEEKRLSEICEVNPSNSRLPEEFIYIDLESVVAGQLLLRNKILRAEAPSRAQRLLSYGDVIFQIVRPYQRNNLFFCFGDEENYVASTGYAQLRAYESKEFLFQIVHHDAFVGKVISKCSGSNYPAINSSELATICLKIPKQKEQQKIAECLISLDNLITAQTQKIDSLKLHKKGLMQQLFPSVNEVAG